MKLGTGNKYPITIKEKDIVNKKDIITDILFLTLIYILLNIKLTKC